MFWEESKERIDKQSYIEVDEEDLYTLKINCKGKRTVGKATKGINVKKTVIDLRKLKIKIIKNRKEKKKKRKKTEKRKTPQNCKSPM